MLFLFITHGLLSQSEDLLRKQYGFYLIWILLGTGINLGKFIWKRMLSFHMSQILTFVIISVCQKLNLKEVRCCSSEEDLKEMLVGRYAVSL